jgi:hypothetical protein
VTVSPVVLHSSSTSTCDRTSPFTWTVRTRQQSAPARRKSAPAIEGRRRKFFVNPLLMNVDGGSSRSSTDGHDFRIGHDFSLVKLPPRVTSSNSNSNMLQLKLKLSSLDHKVIQRINSSLKFRTQQQSVAALESATKRRVRDNTRIPYHSRAATHSFCIGSHALVNLAPRVRPSDMLSQGGPILQSSCSNKLMFERINSSLATQREQPSTTSLATQSPSTTFNCWGVTFVS